MISDHLLDEDSRGRDGEPRPRGIGKDWMALMSNDGLPQPIATPCAELAKAGDVAGLLAWLRDRSVLHMPDAAMDQLATAIRALQRKDADELIELAYAEVVGFIMMLLVRYEIHVERRFSQSDQHGGDPTHVPCDLIDEDWLGRIERLSRFLMEVTATRERVRHLSRLNTNAPTIRLNHSWGNGGPLDANRGQAPQGQGAAGGRRNGRQEGRFQFP